MHEECSRLTWLGVGTDKQREPLDAHPTPETLGACEHQCQWLYPFVGFQIRLQVSIPPPMPRLLRPLAAPRAWDAAGAVRHDDLRSVFPPSGREAEGGRTASLTDERHPAP
ncbi:hypothetical protein VFPFJ_09397 [Purpureocillium lilacinum]|uniref:Uncharacterized protein n=1 Tax=Purpureocillium lilacinum TaxID=33203 RepID=A0A179GSS2_PURLI|nr:hypothetical protein VFPFJ_09397 [Purpureocillium lilacinum]OAQ80944.1 hypothetical protein VFPFJ_09397 [Purpureocillium lilacinum]